MQMQFLIKSCVTTTLVVVQNSVVVAVAAVDLVESVYPTFDQATPCLTDDLIDLDGRMTCQCK